MIEDTGEFLGTKLLADAYQQAQDYQSDQVIVMWGDDFSHRYAHETYTTGQKAMDFAKDL